MTYTTTYKKSIQLMVDSTLQLPVIDIAPFLREPNSNEALTECRNLVQALLDYSAFALKDYRVSEQENSKFLDLMEDYFHQDTELKLIDSRPDLSYQVGSTPELIELPRVIRINLVRKRRALQGAGKENGPSEQAA